MTFHGKSWENPGKMLGNVKWLSSFRMFFPDVSHDDFFHEIQVDLALFR